MKKTGYLAKILHLKFSNLHLFVKRNTVEFISAAILLVATLIIFWPKPQSSSEVLGKDINQVENSDVITYSTSTPEETAPDSDFEWTGRDENPKKIIIPAIGVDNFIQNVGVDQNNEIAVPNNIHIAGWFVNTVLPGEKGLSIIDGHVDGTQSGGVFRNLSNLKTDQEFTIVLGNNKELKYKVLNVSSVATEQAVSKLFSQNPKVISQLNLITCGGNWDESQQKYDQRIIVTAELIH